MIPINTIAASIITRPMTPKVFTKKLTTAFTERTIASPAFLLHSILFLAACLDVLAAFFCDSCLNLVLPYSATVLDAAVCVAFDCLVVSLVLGGMLS